MCFSGRLLRGPTTCADRLLITLAVPALSVAEERHHDRAAGHGAALAPLGLPAVLAMEITLARRPAQGAIEVRSLIRWMSLENPLWGAPRIHGELLKLGIEIAQSTAAKYMARRRPGGSGRTPGGPSFGTMQPASAPWTSLWYRRSTFGCCRFLILRHQRRQLISLSVTDHPTAEGIAQQITEAFPWSEAPSHLIHDRDARYGRAVRRRIAGLRRECIFHHCNSPTCGSRSTYVDMDAEAVDALLRRPAEIRAEMLPAPKRH